MSAGIVIPRVGGKGGAVDGWSEKEEGWER